MLASSQLAKRFREMLKGKDLIDHGLDLRMGKRTVHRHEHLARADFLAAQGDTAEQNMNRVDLTWRDQAVAGPLRMEQLVSLALAAAMLGVLVVRTIRERSSLASGGAASVEDGALGGDLPDPDERPSF